MRSALALIILLMAGCTSRISADIAEQVARNGSERLDLGKVGSAEWERVCFFGPYMNDEEASKVLGFSWDLPTGIASSFVSESINVLVFLKGQSVVAYTEHKRSEQDFWRLNGKCFSRDKAIFVRGQDSYVQGD